MLIRTEPQALAPAQANLRASNDITNELLDRLATGLRANRVEEDVLAVNQAAQFQGEIRALNAARNNVAQAQSLLTTAQGGLENIGGILEDLREIALDATSNTLSTNERAFREAEFNDLLSQITDTVNNTTFNDLQVLAGTLPPPAGQVITGTPGADNINTGAGADAITALGGDDVINATAGNDQVVSSDFSTPGLNGRIFQSGPFGAIANIAESENIIATQPVFANFRATTLDYPNGATNTQNGQLGALLGVDAASLDNPAAATTFGNQLVFEFTGTITAPAAGNYNFSIGSDDGFDLQINGASVLSFPGPRGFNFTNGNVFLNAGENDFRLVYFENGGQEGIEVFSDVGGANAIVTSAITSTPESDGNDIIDGGTGTDTVVFTGNQADYTVAVISPTQVVVTDNRTGSPNGTDTLFNVENLQFADGTQVVGVGAPDPDTGDVDFQVSEDSQNIFTYSIVDAQLSSLFDTPAALGVGTTAQATNSVTAIEEAQRRLAEQQGYVAGLQSGSEFIDGGLLSRIGGNTTARDFFQNTDIPQTGTEYIQRVLRQNAAAAQIAQTNLFNRENVGLLLNVGIRTLSFE